LKRYENVNYYVNKKKVSAKKKLLV